MLSEHIKYSLQMLGNLRANIKFASDFILLFQ